MRRTRSSSTSTNSKTRWFSSSVLQDEIIHREGEGAFRHGVEDEGIGPGAAAQGVFARAADQGVIPVAAMDEIIATKAVEHIIAAAAVQPVTAAGIGDVFGVGGAEKLAVIMPREHAFAVVIIAVEHPGDDKAAVIERRDLHIAFCNWPDAL